VHSDFLCLGNFKAEAFQQQILAVSCNGLTVSEGLAHFVNNCSTMHPSYICVTCNVTFVTLLYTISLCVFLDIGQTKTPQNTSHNTPTQYTPKNTPTTPLIESGGGLCRSRFVTNSLSI